MADLPNVGDLARVVRVCGCERSQRWLGRYGHVDSFRSVGIENIVCDRCDKPHDVAELALIRGYHYPRAWLARVPPLAELESVDIVTELEAEHAA